MEIGGKDGSRHNSLKENGVYRDVMLRLIVLTGFMIVALGANAQKIELDSFGAHQKEDQIRLSWTLRSGFTCNGIEIERSTDPAGNFQEVGDIQGVCGSPVENVTYRFTDQPLPGFGRYYYRLKLGLQGYSDVISVYFLQFNDQCFSVFPNPVTADSRLNFCGQAVGNGVLRVFDAHGNLVKELTWNANNSSLKPVIQHVRSGVYFFTWEGNVNIRGSFVVPG